MPEVGDFGEFRCDMQYRMNGKNYGPSGTLTRTVNLTTIKITGPDLRSFQITVKLRTKERDMFLFPRETLT
ncbi:MAG: hypothetical protein ACRDL7_14955 [Gaiellaceae bacterium]